MGDLTHPLPPCSQANPKALEKRGGTKNHLQTLYNYYEREFAEHEARFLAADKHRLEAKVALNEILNGLTAATEKLGHYPQATVLKRIRLIETLIKDLDLRFAAERRSFNALGFLLSRLRGNLAVEMLEPKLYNKIRAALAEEETLKALREKYPDADAVITAPKPMPAKRATKSIRLMLIAAANLHYAIPVQRILKKTPADGPVAAKLRSSGYNVTTLPVGPQIDLVSRADHGHPFPLINGKAPEKYAHAIAYSDLKEQRRIVYCDEYFKPIEIPQRMLKQAVTYVPSGTGQNRVHRPVLKFYGRQFFVYGARLSYTVRPGGRANSPEH